MRDSNDHFGGKGGLESHDGDQLKRQVEDTLRMLFSKTHGKINSRSLPARFAELQRDLNPEAISASGREEDGRINTRKVAERLADIYNEVREHLDHFEPLYFRNGEEGKQEVLALINQAFVSVAELFNENGVDVKRTFISLQNVGRPRVPTVPPPSLGRQDDNAKKGTTPVNNGGAEKPRKANRRDSGAGPWVAVPPTPFTRTERPSRPESSVPVPAVPKNPLPDFARAPAKTSEVDGNGKTVLAENISDDAATKMAPAEPAVKAAPPSEISERREYHSGIPVPKSALSGHAFVTAPTVQLNIKDLAPAATGAGVPDPRRTMNMLVEGEKPGLWGRFKRGLKKLFAEETFEPVRSQAFQPGAVPQPENLEKSKHVQVAQEAKPGIFARIGNWIKNHKKLAVGAAMTVAAGSAGVYAAATHQKSQEHSDEAAYVQSGNTAASAQNQEPAQTGAGVPQTPNAPEQTPQTLLKHQYSLGVTGGAQPYKGQAKITQVKGFADATPVRVDPPTTEDISKFQTQNADYIKCAKGLMQIYEQDPSRFLPEALEFIQSGNNAQILHDLGNLDAGSDSDPQAFRTKFLNKYSPNDIQSAEGVLNHMIAAERAGDVAGGMENLVNDKTLRIGFDVTSERSVEVLGVESSAPGTPTPGVAPQQNKGTNGGKTPGTQGFNAPGANELNGPKTGFNIIRVPDSTRWSVGPQKTYGHAETSHTYSSAAPGNTASSSKVSPQLAEKFENLRKNRLPELQKIYAAQAESWKDKKVVTGAEAKKIFAEAKLKAAAADPIKAAAAAERKANFKVQMNGKFERLWAKQPELVANIAAKEEAAKAKPASVPETRMATRAEIDALLLKQAA